MPRTPEPQVRLALQGVAGLAALLEGTATMLRDRGRAIGREFGEDFDALARRIHDRPS